jgi:glycosyltransferase involved in cell wall biosynthesis
VRVVLAAFACRPGRGSEMGAGWAIAEGAARLGHEVVLVTQPRHRDDIERARRDDPNLADHLEPVYIGLPARCMDLWERFGRLRGLQLYSLVWQLLLLRRVRALHRVSAFDVGHHVTMSTDWIPSGLAFVDDLPVVWGPVGGAERVPEACRAYLGVSGRLTERVRSITAGPMRSRLAARAGRRCALLVAQNEQEAQWLRSLGPPVVVRPNVFLDDDVFRQPQPRSIAAHTSPAASVDAAPVDAAPVAVFAGRLLAWKGVHAAIATMRQPEMAGWRLLVFGDGPERRRLGTSIAQWGLADRVSLVGQRPRAEMLEALRTADAFLFPSMREAAGWVVGEALAVGCPVVCLDTGGPPQLLRGTGHAVTPGPRLVEDMATALQACLGDARSVVRWDRHGVGELLAHWYGAVSRPGLRQPGEVADRV